jgi:hypothetical protein
MLDADKPLFEYQEDINDFMQGYIMHLVLPCSSHGAGAC